MSPKKIQFKIDETVVYPKHGVGEIVKIETMEIAEIKSTFYVVKMEQSKLTIRVPIDKQEEVGLRKISSKKIIDEVKNDDYDEFKIDKLDPNSGKYKIDIKYKASKKSLEINLKESVFLGDIYL